MGFWIGQLIGMVEKLKLKALYLISFQIIYNDTIWM
jgi:hypothetical protein